jgi:hypothetical protein
MRALCAENGIDTSGITLTPAATATPTVTVNATVAME